MRVCSCEYVCVCACVFHQTIPRESPPPLDQPLESHADPHRGTRRVVTQCVARLQRRAARHARLHRENVSLTVSAPEARHSDTACETGVLRTKKNKGKRQIVMETSWFYVEAHVAGGFKEAKIGFIRGLVMRRSRSWRTHLRFAFAEPPLHGRLCRERCTSGCGALSIGNARHCADWASQ